MNETMSRFLVWSAIILLLRHEEGKAALGARLRRKGDCFRSPSGGEKQEDEGNEDGDSMTSVQSEGFRSPIGDESQDDGEADETMTLVESEGETSNDPDYEGAVAQMAHEDEPEASGNSSGFGRVPGQSENFFRN